MWERGGGEGSSFRRKHLCPPQTGHPHRRPTSRSSRPRPSGGIGFTGRHAEYTQADTWYPSWASDDNMYSPWTDGSVDWPIERVGMLTTFNVHRTRATAPARRPGGLSGTGNAKDHRRRSAEPAGRRSGRSRGLARALRRPVSVRQPGPQRRLVLRHLLPRTERPCTDGKITYNWPWLGPFVGFRYSTDLGKTWTQTPVHAGKAAVRRNGLNGEPVKIGAPHFVDFGKNMEHSPDGKAYLVAHGAARPDSRGSPGSPATRSICSA